VQNQQNPLHRARVGCGLSLTELGNRTQLSPRFLRILDEGRFADLPGGLYARAFVRSYASAVGLDPDRIVDELSDQLPVAHDPIPRMREIARTDDPDWVITVEDAQAAASAWFSSLSGRLQAHLPTRGALGEAALDGSVLIGLQAVLAVVTAWMCGVHVQSLLTSAGAALAAVWGLQVGVYLSLASRVRQRRTGIVLRLPQFRLPEAMSFAAHQSRHA